MIGIVAEVIFGFGLAAFDVWQVSQLAIKSDWQNQPIFAFEAQATIFVKPLEHVEGLENLPKPPFSSMWGKFRMPNEGNGNPVSLVLGRAGDLASGAFAGKEIDVRSDNVTESLFLDRTGKRGIAICFKIYFDRNSASFANGTLMPNELNAVLLTLPMRCEVLSGSMRIELDGRTNLVFQIPGQITFVKCASSVETNGAFFPINFSREERAKNPFPAPDTNTDFLYLHD